MARVSRRTDLFFDKLKRALEETGNGEAAEKLKPFSGPLPSSKAKEGLDELLKFAIVELAADTVSSGLKTFVCCSNQELVKRFSRGKRTQAAKNFNPNSPDPFKTKSKTKLLTWDLLANKYVSIDTERYWEITGTPVVLSPDLIDLLRKIVSRLYITERK